MGETGTSGRWEEEGWRGSGRAEGMGQEVDVLGRKAIDSPGIGPIKLASMMTSNDQYCDVDSTALAVDATASSTRHA